MATRTGSTTAGPRSPGVESIAPESPFDLVAVVADGMGGGAFGEVCSGIVIAAVREVFVQGNYAKWVREQGLGAYDEQGVLREFVRIVNRSILHHANARGVERMGTTVDLLVAKAGRYFWVHVGDSRLYTFAGETRRFEQVTKDHNLAQFAASKGIAAERVKKGSLVTSMLGTSATFVADVGQGTLSEGMVFVLCSDGLDRVGESDYRKYLEPPAHSLMEASRSLAEAGVRRRGPKADNATVVLVEHTSKERAAGADQAPPDAAVPTLEAEEATREFTREYLWEPPAAPAVAARREDPVRRFLYEHRILLGVVTGTCAMAFVALLLGAGIFFFASPLRDEGDPVAGENQGQSTVEGSAQQGTGSPDWSRLSSNVWTAVSDSLQEGKHYQLPQAVNDLTDNQKEVFWTEKFAPYAAKEWIKLADDLLENPSSARFDDLRGIWLEMDSIGLSYGVASSFKDAIRNATLEPPVADRMKSFIGETREFAKKLDINAVTDEDPSFAFLMDEFAPLRDQVKKNISERIPEWRKLVERMPSRDKDFLASVFGKQWNRVLWKIEEPSDGKDTDRVIVASKRTQNDIQSALKINQLKEKIEGSSIIRVLFNEDSEILQELRDLGLPDNTILEDRDRFLDQIKVYRERLFSSKSEHGDVADESYTRFLRLAMKFNRIRVAQGSREAQRIVIRDLERLRRELKGLNGQASSELPQLLLERNITSLDDRLKRKIENRVKEEFRQNVNDLKSKVSGFLENPVRNHSEVTEILERFPFYIQNYTEVVTSSFVTGYRESFFEKINTHLERLGSPENLGALRCDDFNFRRLNRYLEHHQRNQTLIAAADNARDLADRFDNRFAKSGSDSGPFEVTVQAVRDEEKRIDDFCRRLAAVFRVAFGGEGFVNDELRELAVDDLKDIIEGLRHRMERFFDSNDLENAKSVIENLRDESHGALRLGIILARFLKTNLEIDGVETEFQNNIWASFRSKLEKGDSSSSRRRTANDPEPREGHTPTENQRTVRDIAHELAFVRHESGDSIALTAFREFIKNWEKFIGEGTDNANGDNRNGS